MDLQCASCLEPTLAGVHHDCSEVIAALRARVAVLEEENKILETIARGCLGTQFAETYLTELRRRAKEG